MMSTAFAVEPADEEHRRRRDLERSFESFLGAHYSPMLRFLLRQCFDRHLAEDALQEALIVAMDRWESVSRHDKPHYWVRRVAWYKLLNLHDRQGWKETVTLDGLPGDVAEPATSHEAEMVLRHTLSQLPYQHRAVLALMVDGDTDEEIALQLGLAVTTVRTYKSEVRKRYRELFRSDGEGGTA